jgi:hypothetical protein
MSMAIDFRTLPDESMLEYFDRLMKMDTSRFSVDQRAARVLYIELALRSLRKNALATEQSALEKPDQATDGRGDPAAWFYERWDRASPEEREAITCYISSSRRRGNGRLNGRHAS